MFDHRLFIFNPNLGVDVEGQLLLKYYVKFDKFISLVVSFLFISELKYLNIIWLINLMIFNKVFVSGFFLLLIFNKS